MPGQRQVRHLSLRTIDVASEPWGLCMLQGLIFTLITAFNPLSRLIDMPPHRSELLSMAQIRDIYAAKANSREVTASNAENVRYWKTSFSGRDPGHPGSPPPPPPPAPKKWRR